MPDRYTYPVTEDLRNKQGIDDPRAAHELETRVAFQRLIEISTHPVVGTFDLDHPCAIHRIVIGDLWECAGEIRNEHRASTGGVEMARPGPIESRV